MKRKRPLIIILLVAVIAVAVWYLLAHSKREIVLTGLVTTDEVIVSSEIQGRLQELLVREVSGEVGQGSLRGKLGWDYEKPERRWFELTLDNVEAISSAMLDTAKKNDLPASVIVLKADNEGVQVLERA